MFDRVNIDALLNTGHEATNKSGSGSCLTLCLMYIT